MIDWLALSCFDVRTPHLNLSARATDDCTEEEGVRFADANECVREGLNARGGGRNE